MRAFQKRQLADPLPPARSHGRVTRMSRRVSRANAHAIRAEQAGTGRLSGRTAAQSPSACVTCSRRFYVGDFPTVRSQKRTESTELSKPDLPRQAWASKQASMGKPSKLACLASQCPGSPRRYTCSALNPAASSHTKVLGKFAFGVDRTIRIPIPITHPRGQRTSPSDGRVLRYGTVCSN